MADHEINDLAVGGETFRVRVDGDATRPAILLSNSLGTDLRMWDAQVAPLAAHFRVVRYDPRGHGDSVDSEGPYSIGQLGRDALAILDALGIAKIHVLGLSMGGAVALWLLVNAPERIDRAILANTAASLGAPETWNARIRSVLAAGMEQNAATTIERWFSRDFAAQESARVAAIHAMLRRSSPHGYAACCAALRDMDLREALHDIGHHVLVVTGSDDPVIPDAATALLTRRIAGARHVELPARHISNIEAADAFNAAVVAFLTAKLPARHSTKRPAKAPPAARRARPRPTAMVRRPVGAAPAKAPKRKTNADTSRRRPSKTAATRVPARKVAAVKAGSKRSAKAGAAKARALKPAAKTPPSRRQANPASARATTAKPAAKAKTAKAPAKKVALKIAATKSGAARKKPAGKSPLPRRKATTRPRRPTGRRK